MLSADRVTGRLEWNTRIVDSSLLREVKGKDRKKPRERDLSGIKTSNKNELSELNSIISTVESTENLPSMSPSMIGTGSVKPEMKIEKMRKKLTGSGGYKVKGKPTYDERLAEIDRIAAKYKVPTKRMSRAKL